MNTPMELAWAYRRHWGDCTVSRVLKRAIEHGLLGLAGVIIRPLLASLFRVVAADLDIMLEQRILVRINDCSNVCHDSLDLRLLVLVKAWSSEEF